MKQEPETVGELLRLHIKGKFDSQEAAAAHFGCSQAMFSNILNGQRRPTQKIIEALNLERREVWVPKGMAVAGLPLQPWSHREVPIQHGTVL